MLQNTYLDDILFTDNFYVGGVLWGGVGDGSDEMAVGYIEMATEVVVVKATMTVKLV